MSNLIKEIKNKIYLIRGQHVMLDKDVAEFYQVQLRVLNQNMNRNKKIFDGMVFQLNKIEYNSFLKNRPDFKSKHLPYVYSYQSVLNMSLKLKNKEIKQDEKNVERFFISQLDLIEKGLKLIKSQYKINKRIIDLLCKDKNGQDVVIEIQIGHLDRVHLYKSIEYRDLIFLKTKIKPRVILVSDFINENFKKICSLYDLEYKEIRNIKKEILTKNTFFEKWNPFLIRKEIDNLFQIDYFK